MALNYLGYLEHLFYYLVEVVCVFEEDTHEGACHEAYLGRVEDKLRAFKYSYVQEALHSLVDSCTRHAALASYCQKRCACILRYER